MLLNKILGSRQETMYVRWYCHTAHKRECDARGNMRLAKVTSIVRTHRPAGKLGKTRIFVEINKRKRVKSAEQLGTTKIFLDKKYTDQREQIPRTLEHHIDT